MKENFHFQIDWASLTLGSKFTIFALFYFVYEPEGNFPSTSSGWQCNRWLFALPLWGSIFGGAHTVHGGGLFSEYYSI